MSETTQPPLLEIFTLRRAIFRLGILMTALVMVLAGFFITSVMRGPSLPGASGSQTWLNFIFPFLTYLFSGLGMMAAFLHTRYLLDDDGIEFQGLFLKRFFTWHELQTVQWNRARVTLTSARASRTVWLGCLAGPDRIRFVQTLRGRLSEEIQTGWNLQVSRCLVELHWSESVQGHNVFHRNLLGLVVFSSLIFSAVAWWWAGPVFLIVVGMLIAANWWAFHPGAP